VKIVYRSGSVTLVCVVNRVRTMRRLPAVSNNVLSIEELLSFRERVASFATRHFDTKSDNNAMLTAVFTA